MMKKKQLWMLIPLGIHRFSNGRYIFDPGEPIKILV
jgi:hypothetical protein